MVLAVWNYAPPNTETGLSKTVTLHFQNTRRRRVLISRVDHEHGDVRPEYEKLGSPRYPTPAQIKDLRQAAQLPSPESRKLKHNELAITIPAQGLALIELK
jgi:xylan 1,4-beta-xylosidase